MGKIDDKRQPRRRGRSKRYETELRSGCAEAVKSTRTFEQGGEGEQGIRKRKVLEKEKRRSSSSHK